MKRDRNCKIVVTVGPSISSQELLEKAHLRGADVFRLNFSHGANEDRVEIYKAIRNIGKKYNTFPTVLADLQGPKLRIGTLVSSETILEEGKIFKLDSDPSPGNAQRIFFPHKEVFQSMKPGVLLLLDDGKLKLEVTCCDSRQLEARVLIGGVLRDRKGVNIPNLRLTIPCLTEKDLQDLKFALDLGVDWVAVSMVQTLEDVEAARKAVGNRAGLMVKLEKPMALQFLEPIVEATDAIMVARGDLGVEMNYSDLPRVQRNIVTACRRFGKPVVVATQMLESMIYSPTPTRAETSDVAAAVYMEADATMLSAESASGQYPLESIEVMDGVIKATEADQQNAEDLPAGEIAPIATVEDAICIAAKDAATYSSASVIFLFTDSPRTVLRCSRLRPLIPIIPVTPSMSFAGRCGLYNGVYPVTAKKEFNLSEMCKTARFLAVERKIATTGDNLVVVDTISSNSLAICRI
ncbi:MAG: pyruvate kinase [Holosporaceae bacterium]|nr:pyruvate kinase [Holosporaceae bacterium]